MFKPSEIREMLRKNVIEVTFTKKNGDVRVMNCTLVENFLPVRANTPGDFGESDQNADNIAVWDIEAGGWRSFNASTVTNIEV